MAIPGAAEEVKLLGRWVSPYVARVGIALNLKGIRYEFLEEAFGCKNGVLLKSELLLKLNPIYKKMPVLVHDGKPLCESLIIVQYIDDVWATEGPSILPSDPFERATARFWAHYIDDKWFPSMSRYLKAKTEEAKAEAAEEAIAGLQKLEEVFEKSSKGEGFFGGESIGYLDIALGCFLGWIRAAETLGGIKLLDEEKVPKLVGWAERFLLDDAVKRAVPETEKILEFRKQLQPLWDARAAN